MDTTHHEEVKKAWQDRNTVRAVTRAEILASFGQRRDDIAEKLKKHNVCAKGLVSRIFRGRRLTATQSYALPSVY